MRVYGVLNHYPLLCANVGRVLQVMSIANRALNGAVLRAIETYWQPCAKITGMAAGTLLCLHAPHHTLTLSVGAALIQFVCGTLLLVRTL